MSEVDIRKIAHEQWYMFIIPNLYRSLVEKERDPE